MSDPFTQVVMAAAELKISARPQFDKFVEAFTVLEEKLKSDLLAADPNVIFPAQGKAQVVAHLRRKLEDCIKLREDILRRP